MTDQLMYSTAELASMTGIPANTLRWWRRTGAGPEYVRLGTKTVRYRAVDVQAWLDERTEHRTGGAA